MAAGTSWSERQPNDWLASNGKWYSHRDYPAGWRRTALPPAPDHAEPDGSAVRRLQTAAAQRLEAANAAVPLNNQHGSRAGTVRTKRPGGQPTPTPTGRPGGSFVTPARGARPSGPAAANVVDQRTFKPKVGAGPAAPPAIGSSGRTNPTAPPPPGRITDAAPDAPAQFKAAAPPAPPANPRAGIPPAPSKGSSRTGGFSTPGDLGQVLKSAKKRVEDAINEAAAENDR